MVFEYIRAIAPSPARAPLELVPAVHLVDSTSDEKDLAELVAHALEQTPEEVSLACPAPPRERLELPRFSGIMLADVPLRPEATPPAQPVPPAALATPPDPRRHLGPGVMTMMLAVFATVAFGVFVVTH